MSAEPVVVQNILRAEPSAVRRLWRAGSATVHEAQQRSGLLAPYLRPLDDDSAIAGPAITVTCQAGDNLMLHLAIRHCQPGDVVVVAMNSECTDGLVGELLATSLRSHGVLGVVIDAGVRDVTALRRMRFPVWSRAVSAHGTVKNTLGSVNVPVCCAGQFVEPGDVIVADQDGVVRVAREDAATIADLAEERMTREEQTLKKLREGVLMADLYDLDRRAADMGLRYIDGSVGDPGTPPTGPLARHDGQRAAR